LPTELAESQVAFLRGKFAAAREVLDTLDTPVPETNSIFSSVEDGFDDIEETRLLYERAYDQEPDAEATHELYEEYLGAIDAVASELQVLEFELVYLDLDQYQRNSTTSSLLDHASSLSSELEDAFGIDITVLPVIWDGFAIDPFDENIPATGDLSQIYVLILPRTQSDPEFYAPILAHELAHAVLDRQDDLKTDFYNVVRSVQRRTRQEIDDEAHFARSWRAWFEELFCDACGVLTFGPAYLSSLARHLHHSNPYYIEKNTDRDLHPPPALRFDLVMNLSDEFFADLIDGIRDDRIAFERHLDALEHSRPRIYETYDYGELRTFITQEVPAAVDHDLEALVDDLTAGVTPDDRPERAHRLATNQYWLDPYPP
jgi:hypothetical protein